MANSERIVLDPTAFARMTGGPGGEIYDYCVKGARKVSTLARAGAPKRTGALSRRITSKARSAGASSVSVRVSCTAPYAWYVHDGTPGLTHDMVLYAGVIKGTRDRASAKGWQHTIGWRVGYRDGQSANPFLSRALNAWVAAERAKGVIL